MRGSGRAAVRRKEACAGHGVATIRKLSRALWCSSCAADDSAAAALTCTPCRLWPRVRWAPLRTSLARLLRHRRPPSLGPAYTPCMQFWSWGGRGGGGVPSWQSTCWRGWEWGHGRKGRAMRSSTRRPVGAPSRPYTHPVVQPDCGQGQTAHPSSDPSSLSLGPARAPGSASMLPRPTTHSKALGPGVAGPELLVATSAVLDRPPAHSAHQPLTGAAPCVVDPAALGDPRQHTQYPYVTGTSVLAVKYKDGVLIGCDTLGSYGSTKRYKSTQRIFQASRRRLFVSFACCSRAPSRASPAAASREAGRS
jgi:hypothetical protein